MNCIGLWSSSNRCEVVVSDDLLWLWLRDMFFAQEIIEGLVYGIAVAALGNGVEQFAYAFRFLCLMLVAEYREFHNYRSVFLLFTIQN